MTTDLRLAKRKQLAAQEAAIRADIEEGMADVDAGRLYAVVQSDHYFNWLRTGVKTPPPAPTLLERLDRIENALLAMEAFGEDHGGVGVAVKDILAGELRWCGGDPKYAARKPRRGRP